jgi:trans-2-enoyl-CoA reductase
MLGGIYVIALEKEEAFTCMGGEGWKQFITRIVSSEKKWYAFSLRGQVTTITVVYLSGRMTSHMMMPLSPQAAT